jgi:p21-activated kinase 1
LQVSLPVDMRPLPKEPEEARTSKSKSKHKKSKDHEKPNISYPTKFTHVVHVGFDDESGEFTGMPEAWARLLVASNISKEMQKKNPQAILDVLNYFEHSSKHKTDEKFMTHTSSTDPSPRPSYSVSSQALSSPSSAHGLSLGAAAAHSPPVSFAAAIAAAAAGSGNANIPSSLHAEPAAAAAVAVPPAVPTRQTSSSSTPSVFSTTPDQEEPEEEEEEEPAPPPIASRPERTKSIYTKPIDEDDDTDPTSLKMPATIDENEMLSTTTTTPADKNSSSNLNNNNNINNSSNSLTNNKANSERQKKKKMTDEEILAKLRTIVTVGDPNRKYTKMEKIGQGASGTVYTAIETATGMEVRIYLPLLEFRYRVRYRTVPVFYITIPMCLIQP